MSKKVYSEIDYTSIDYEGLRNDMIECIKRRIPDYTDFSESDFGVVMVELFAHGLDVISYYMDRHANEMFLSTCKDRKSALKIASQLDYTPRYATPAQFQMVFEVEASSAGGALIPKGFKVKTIATELEPQVVFEVESDYLIPEGHSGLEKDSGGNYQHLINVVQGATMTREILGTSDGSASQAFQLGYEPVLIDTLVIEVWENGRYVEWTRVDNFLSSKMTDRHFTAQVDEFDAVSVTFSDGVHGMIPYTYENGIVATYRVGGGTFGNVGENRIVIFDSTSIPVRSVFNPYTAKVKGTDRETLEELKRNIPASVRTLNRAVTLQDYTSLALGTNWLLSANTLRTGKLEATVYVVEKNAQISAGKITLSDDTYNYLKGYLQARTMVGCTVIVKPATLKRVDVTVRYRAKNSTYNGRVEQAIRDYIGTKMSLGAMGVGEELILSDMIADMTNVTTGIDYLRSCYISSPADDIIEGNTSTASTLTGDEAIVIGTLTVEVM